MAAAPSIASATVCTAESRVPKRPVTTSTVTKSPNESAGMRNMSRRNGMATYTPPNMLTSPDASRLGISVAGTTAPRPLAAGGVANMSQAFELAEPRWRRCGPDMILEGAVTAAGLGRPPATANHG